MKKTLIILLLIISGFAYSQDIRPIDPINFKNLQSPSFSFYTLDSSVWIFKGSLYGWTKLASARKMQHLIDSLANVVQLKSDTTTYDATKYWANHQGFKQTLSIDSLNRVFSLGISGGNTVKFKDENTTYNTFTNTVNGLVPAPNLTGTTRYLRQDGTWVVPPDNNTTYSEITEAEITTGTATTLRTITGQRAAFIAERNKGTATPNALGTAAVGTSVLYSRQDHIHQMPTIEVLGLVNISGKATNDVLQWDGTNWINTPGNLHTHTNKALLDAIKASDTLRWATDLNTTYSAGTGLNLSGTTFNHSNAITAGTTNPSTNQTPAFGAAFTVPKVTYDAQGHITAVGTQNVTLPANPNTDNQTLSFTSPNLSISGGNSVNISGINTDSQTLSTTGAAGNISISGGNTINLNVNDADASATNEGALTVTAGTATTSVINSNTSGSTPVTISASTGLSISETGNTITLTNTAPDTYGAVTKGNLTENITGLEFSATRQVIGGATDLSLSSGYVIPTTTEQGNWNAGYNDKINSAAFTGTTTKTLTLNQQDGGTVIATFDDLNTVYTHPTGFSNQPASALTGANVISQVNVNTEGHVTGVQSRGLTLGDLSFSYPGAGIPLSTGTGWGTSITNNSANWNTAYGWGDHSGLYLPIAGTAVAANRLPINNTTEVSSLTYMQLSTQNDAGDSPTGGYASILKMGHGNPDTYYARYLGFDFFTEDIYTRKRVVGTGGNWYKLHTDANFIAGTHYQAALTNPVTGTGTTNYLPKWTGLATQGNSQIFDNGSAIGIGTTNPTSKLQVEGTVRSNQTSISFYSTNTAPTTVLRSDLNGVRSWQVDDVGGSMYIWNQSAGQYMLNVVGSRVGIANTDPITTLDVNGNARFRSIGTTASTTVLGVTSDGTLTTNVTVTESDPIVRAINGIIKSNGTTISAAVAGTDYQAPITGAATTITTADLTASRALISNASGKVDISSVTSTELGHLSGVTSAIQTQLNARALAATTLTINGVTQSLAANRTWTIATGSSNWTRSGDGLYPAVIGDELRIGSATDLGAQKLQVNAASVFRLRLDNTEQPIEFITAGTGTQPNFRLTHDGSGGLIWAAWNGLSYTSYFSIGAGAHTPKFDGGLILGQSFSTATTGSIRFNGTNFQGHNGSAWINLDATGVISFNSRTGAVIPASGDYTASMVTNAAAVDVNNTFGIGQSIISVSAETMLSIINTNSSSIGINIRAGSASSDNIRVRNSGGNTRLTISGEGVIAGFNQSSAPTIASGFSSFYSLNGVPFFRDGASTPIQLSGGNMVYPGAGIALSTGTGWGTSITNNSANWNTAFSWGNHALAGYQPFITAGTTAQYMRGDKSWQTLNTSVVPELTNLYYTNARSRGAISLTTTGTSGAATYSSATGVLNIPQYSGGGTVTSVGLAMPNIFSVTGSPVTTSGTLTAALANQTGNTVFASPSGGGSGTPTFRGLVSADIPNLDASKITSGTFGTTRIADGAITFPKLSTYVAPTDGQYLRHHTHYGMIWSNVSTSLTAGHIQYGTGTELTGESAFIYNSTTNTANVDTLKVLNHAYSATEWNGNLSVPTKDAVRDKIESMKTAYDNYYINTSIYLTQNTDVFHNIYTTGANQNSAIYAIIDVHLDHGPGTYTHKSGNFSSSFKGATAQIERQNYVQTYSDFLITNVTVTPEIVVSGSAATFRLKMNTPGVSSFYHMVLIVKYLHKE